jgi:hypothetical protein
LRLPIEHKKRTRVTRSEGIARNGYHAVDVRASALATVAYADLFDYPLTVDEVVRFQVATNYSKQSIARALRGLAHDQGILTISASGSYYSVRGREVIFSLRPQRERASQLVWRRARLWARMVARTPYVRMVAVTGALSMRNISGRPDIDLLVVTQPGRVWICRRLLVLQVRLARFFGDDLCPNYILSSNRLELDQRDFFTAHELAQMAPLYGEATYREMLAQNQWSAEYLPAAFHRGRGNSTCKTTSPIALTSALERLMGLRLFDRWEVWELRRLRSKLSPTIGKAAEVVCSPEQCKGHTGLHRSTVMTRFRDRLQQLDILEPFAFLFDISE